MDTSIVYHDNSLSNYSDLSPVTAKVLNTIGTARLLLTVTHYLNRFQTSSFTRPLLQQGCQTYRKDAGQDLRSSCRLSC